ncbi:hypothetical protein IMSAGC004_03546 [Bacteroidaceae bacterium]|nr:hypothetical protein IMSAGC004_03546 [Bacteroidaceae bacterium]
MPMFFGIIQMKYAYVFNRNFSYFAYVFGF